MDKKLYVKHGTFLIETTAFLQGSVLPRNHGMTTEQVEKFVRNGILDYYNEQEFAQVRQASIADRKMHADARAAGEKKIPTTNRSPWSYNPKDLATLSLETLQGMIREGAPSDIDGIQVDIPTTREECIAVLASDFEG